MRSGSNGSISGGTARRSRDGTVSRPTGRTLPYQNLGERTGTRTHNVDTERRATAIRIPDAAIVVLAGTKSPSELGRVVNGLQTAQEFDDAGDSVEILFDSAGTQWIPELEDEDHDYHSLYAELTGLMSACNYSNNCKSLHT